MKIHSLVLATSLTAMSLVGCTGMGRSDYQNVERKIAQLPPEKRMMIDVPMPNFEKSGTRLLKSEPFQCELDKPLYVKHYFVIDKPLERTFFSYGSPDNIAVIFEHSHGRPLHAWVDTDGKDDKAEAYWEGTSIPGYPDKCKVIEWVRNPEKAHYQTADELAAKIEERKTRRKGSSGGVGGLPAQMLNTLKNQGLVAN